MKISKCQRLINKLMESTTESICKNTGLKVIICHNKYQFRTDSSFRILNSDGSAKTEWNIGSINSLQGYSVFGLRIDNDSADSVSLHRVIASLFLYGPNKPDYTIVNHIITEPGKPLDNSVSNLEWSNHLRNNGIQSKGARRIGQYSLENFLIREWFAASKELTEAGFNIGNINSCCNNKRLTHKKFIWKYHDVEEHAAYKELAALDVKRQKHNLYLRQQYSKNKSTQGTQCQHQ